MRRVDEVQRPEGYRIVGAFEASAAWPWRASAVIHNLAWGDTLYVDDLSTLPEARGRGHGRALLEWCKEEGARQGCAAVPPRLGRWARARGRPPALLQHRPAHHELPLRGTARMIERELEALVAVSSPSGDVRRRPRSAWRSPRRSCPPRRRSSACPARPPGHAEDLVGRLRGTGARRLLLLGHLDTVVAPRRAPAARAATATGSPGSGAVDMKGGVALALGADARAGRAARAVRGGGDPARERRGVAHGAVHPRRALRRLRRLPVLRGRRADRAGRRGRDRQAQGGGDAARERARALGALRLGAASWAAARCWRSPRRRSWWRATTTRRAPTGSPRCRRSCARATPSTSCPPRASSLCDLRADRLEAFEPVFAAVPERARRGAARVDAGARVAGHGLARGHRARARRGERAARPPDRRLRARRRERRQPHRGRRGRLHDRRAGPARRRRAHARTSG